MKNNFPPFWIVVIAIVIGTTGLPLKASAYIDLGLAGSMFQAFYLIVVGLVAFVLSPLLFFWKRISHYLKSLRPRTRGNESIAEPPEGQ